SQRRSPMCESALERPRRSTDHEGCPCALSGKGSAGRPASERQRNRRTDAHAARDQHLAWPEVHMKKTGIICAALLGSAVAVRAQQAPPAVPPNHPYSPNQDKTTELAGKLNSVDSGKRSLTISLGSGQRQVG